ncbi:hypothetical protein [Leifsonia sp. 1010]|uniref:hypothetical protein n=1 Tax=Leifsonia sp. 1010 TaxID=2817769 RepID=UPI002857353E|nr:hypothetical protein [Leifsonia sp. 1010]MDR6613087.1 hypothetical protein [Leifsonia sp. 1010]
MAVADFAEKTFEIAYDIELATGAGGNPAVYAPSQVFEQLLGFDAAANPDPDHVLWKVLNAPRPRGLTLLSTNWSGSGLPKPLGSDLPAFPVSYIVQFKRPEFLRGARAAQWTLWRAPYYRFRREPTQQRVLKRLEINVGTEAVVRYAAPAFHTNQELDAARWTRSIISRTGHVAPSTLADHKVWTYQEADSPGRGNPTGPLRSFDSFNTLFRPLEEGPARPSGLAVQGTAVVSHVDLLARAALLREPALRRVIYEWDASLQEAGVSFRERHVACSYAAVQTLMSWIGARWWLLDQAAVRSEGAAEAGY